MKTLIFRLTMLFIIAALLVLSVPIQIQAVNASQLEGPTAETQPDCSSSQVILIIDQSRSMELRNDPNDLRFYLPLHVADILARNYINARLTNNRFQRPMKVELAVVQFASDAIVGLSWINIAPVDEAAWQEQRQKISDSGLLTKDDYRQMYESISNGTNMQTAFKQAAELVEDAGAQVSGCPKRTFLMVTDGNPDQNGEPIKEPELRPYMQKVQSIADGFLNKDDLLFVTAINDSTDNYWKDTEKYWLQITHDQDRTNPEEPVRAERVSSKAEIGFRVDKIINYRLHKGISSAQAGRNVLPPYLERAIFTFYKPDKNNIIELKDPQGNTIAEGPNAVITGTTEGIQTLELIRPLPGPYTLVTNARSGEYYITKDLIFIQTKLQSDVTGWNQFGCNAIDIGLVDSNNQPLPNYGDEKYRLVVKAELTAVDEKGQEKTIPVSLNHDMNNNRITGSITPVYPGTNHLSITAVANDDDQKSWDVLVPPYADYDLQIDPLAVQIGDPQNVAMEGCAPSQFASTRLPLTFIDTILKAPANVCVQAKFDISGNGISSSAISLPDKPGGPYSLTLTPENSGNLELNIKASADNPKTGENIIIGSASKTFEVQQGHRYTFSLKDPNVAPSKLVESIERTLLSMRGQPAPDRFVVGRRFFFQKPDITLAASFVEGNAHVNQPSLLPGVSLIPLGPGKPETGQPWQSANEGLTSSFSAVPLGCYIVDVSKINNVCNASVQTVQSYSNICVVPDLSERVIELIGILLGLGLLVGLIIYLICRFTNPLKGYIAVADANNYAGWFASIEDFSCWNFKLDEVHTCCLTRIVIQGAFRQKGTFKLIYYIRNMNSLKEEKGGEVMCDIHSWHSIPFGANCHIIWVADYTQLPR